LTLEVKHLFTNNVADEPGFTGVKPSDWNAAHTLTQAGERLLGKADAGAGSTTEVSLGTGLEFSGGAVRRSAITGDVAVPAGSNEATLATVNPNVGTFGAADTAVALTVDGKGRITAIIQGAIAIAISQVTGLASAIAALVPTSRTITAGAGLTGGGDLSSDRTLDVGAGTGIAVNANDVALASIADQRVLANVSGGAAAPVANTLTAIIDACIGSTANGDLLFRSGGVWTRLPVGTNTHVLTLTAGAPGWAAPSGGGGGGIGRDILINPDGRIDQRNGGAAATTADDAYGGPDRWYSLTQTASIQVQRQTNGEDGTPFFTRLTQTQASAQRMGRAQIVENRDCGHLRGQPVVLSGRIRCSASQAIRYAILEWTGTADTVTSDVVNDWTNGTFTAGQFFNSTTLNVLQVGSVTPSANTWTDLTEITASCGSSLTNLIVMIWTEGTIAQNETLDFRMKLEAGSSATAFVPRAHGQELTLCERFYQKSYQLADVPGASTTDGASLQRSPGSNLSWSAVFKTRMRITPTVTIYSTTGASGNMRNLGAGSDLAAQATFPGEAGFTLDNAASASSGALYGAHWTAVAEL